MNRDLKIMSVPGCGVLTRILHALHPLRQRILICI